MSDLDTSLCLREFWECLDSSQRDSLRRFSIRDDDEALQCKVCSPCYKAAIIALTEKSYKTGDLHLDQDTTMIERETIWASKLCEFLGVYSNDSAWERNSVALGGELSLADDVAGSKEGNEGIMSQIRTSTMSTMASVLKGKGSAMGMLASEKPTVKEFARILPLGYCTGDDPIVFDMPNGMAETLVDHICNIYDPTGKSSDTRRSNNSSSGGKRKGKKGRKGKRGKGKKGKSGGNRGVGSSSSDTSTEFTAKEAHFAMDSTLIDDIFTQTSKGSQFILEDMKQNTGTGKSKDLKSKGKSTSLVTSPRAGRKRCWYCEKKVCLRFLDLLTYPRPVRKFKMLLSPSMLLKDLRLLLAREVNINVEDLVLMKKGRHLPFQIGSNFATDAANYGDFDSVTISQIGLKWNQLVVISQVALSLRTTDSGSNEQSNQDEQNKQFVGDLLFGQTPPEGSDANRIGQAQRTRVHNGYQVIGQLLSSTFKDTLLGAWKAELSARQMSAALLNDLDKISEETNKSFDLDDDDWAGGGNGNEKSGKKGKKKKKKKKKKKEVSNRITEKELREEEQKLAAQILASRQETQAKALAQAQARANEEEARKRFHLEQERLEREKIAALQREAETKRKEKERIAAEQKRREDERLARKIAAKEAGARAKKAREEAIRKRREAQKLVSQQKSSDSETQFEKNKSTGVLGQRTHNNVVAHLQNGANQAPNPPLQPTRQPTRQPTQQPTQQTTQQTTQQPAQQTTQQLTPRSPPNMVQHQQMQPSEQLPHQESPLQFQPMVTQQLESHQFQPQQYYSEPRIPNSSLMSQQLSPQSGWQNESIVKGADNAVKSVFCPSCGAGLTSATVNFCTTCGARLMTQQPKQPQVSTQNVDYLNEYGLNDWGMNTLGPTSGQNLPQGNGSLNGIFLGSNSNRSGLGTFDSSTDDRLNRLFNQVNGVNGGGNTFSTTSGNSSFQAGNGMTPMDNLGQNQPPPLSSLGGLNSPWQSSLAPPPQPPPPSIIRSVSAPLMGGIGQANMVQEQFTHQNSHPQSQGNSLEHVENTLLSFLE